MVGGSIQPGFAVWLTGLPSSGKTSLARAVGLLLAERGIEVQVLDSDELRRTFTPRPTYSEEERDWFYGVVVFLAGLLTDNGVNVVIAATASRRKYREVARARLLRFAEVYLECPQEVCRRRDTKGLWKKVDTGEIKGLPGSGVPYEAPESPEVRINTENLSIQEGALSILNALEQQDLLLPG